VRLLLQNKKTNIGLLNNENKSPHKIAMEKGHREIARLLYNPTNEASDRETSHHHSRPWQRPGTALNFARMLKRSFHSTAVIHRNQNNRLFNLSPSTLRPARKIISFRHSKTYSLPIDSDTREVIRLIVNERKSLSEQTAKHDLILQEVKLMKENIIEHAALRVDLFFYLMVALYGKGVTVTKNLTVKQHGKGSTYLNSHACHNSLFSNVPVLSGTFLQEALDSTFELPAIVNGFDGHLEGRIKPSRWVKECLFILNLVSQKEINPTYGMTLFFHNMDDFFSSPKDEYFQSVGKTSSPAAKMKVYQLEKQGTFSGANADTSVKDEYIHLMLRLRPEEISEVRQNPHAILKYYQRMQDEIYSVPGEVSKHKRHAL
jgi:hypothetical protein